MARDPGTHGQGARVADSRRLGTSERRGARGARRARARTPPLAVLILMPGAGLEPALPCGKGILSPSRLPVSPSRRAVTPTIPSPTLPTSRMHEAGRELGRKPCDSRPACIGASHRHAGTRAGNGTRTRDPNLGKVVLYQLSYSRVREIYPSSRPPAKRVDRIPHRPREQSRQRCVAAIRRGTSVGVHELRCDAVVERRPAQPLQHIRGIRAD
jgi:hypothetical protein